MALYAYVDFGIVVELYETGDRPITDFFHPDMLWIDVTNVEGIQPNWIAENVDGAWYFHVYVEPEPTPEQIVQKNGVHLEYLKNLAGQSMAPVLLSLQLGDSTEEEVVVARLWQTYYRDLQAVDLSVPNPAWPEPPSEM
ncbi:tail fiber assembly protein [Pseudomonas rhizophila]